MFMHCISLHKQTTSAFGSIHGLVLFPEPPLSLVLHSKLYGVQVYLLSQHTIFDDQTPMLAIVYEMFMAKSKGFLHT